MTDLIFSFAGINILIMFLYKRQWLIEKRTYITILVLNIILFITGCLMPVLNITDNKIVGVLKMPLLSLIIFKVMYAVFFKIYERAPVDTFWSMNSSLLKDGMFNFIFWVLGMVLPVVMVFMVNK